MSSNNAYLAAIVGGAVLWQGTAMLAGGHEAWDYALYWLLAYPAGLVLAGAISYYHPHRPWRWGLAMMWAEAVVMTIGASSFGLLPLGLIMFGVLAIPPMAVAVVVGSVRRRAMNKATADAATSD